MKTSRRAVVPLMAFIGLTLTVRAVDLTVPAGETLSLSESAAYDTVTVNGTLEVADGAKLTAANVALGPNKGDVAVIRLLGGAADSLKVTGTVTVGAEGGTGKIVASAAASSSTKVVNLVYLTVSASAAVTPGSAYVDVLELGPGICDLKTFTNQSEATARVVVDGGSLGASQYWGAYRFVGPFRIEGATPTSTVAFNAGYTQYRVNNGSLTVANCGNVSFTGGANAENHWKKLFKGVLWENVGNLVLAAQNRLSIDSDDLLPFGEGCGIVDATAAGTWIDVQNHRAKVNGLKSAAPVRGTAGGSIVFGDGNTDGVLAGSITNVVSVGKVGSGALTVTGESSVGSFTVSEGVLKVSSPLAVESLVVGEDAVLEIDGQDVRPSVLADVRGRVVLKNGGRLLTSLACEDGVRLSGLGYQGTVEKTGAGCYIIDDPAVMTTNVHVKVGTLAFSAAGYACRLFRWNVTDWNNIGWMDAANGAANNRFYLAELAFVGTDGARVGKNLVTAENGTDPGSMPSGSACFVEGTCFATNAAGRAGNLFDSNQYPRISVESPLTTEEGGVTLYVRLPDDAAPVSAINFAANWGGFPKSWTLSGSLDGGTTWTVLNEATGFVPSVNDSEHWMGANGEKYADPVPKAFPFSSTNPAFARPGVLNMPESMAVEVDAGATLDFGNVTGGQRIHSLTLDGTAGGGTIINAAFAESGILFLKNVPEGVKVKDLVVSLTLTNPIDIKHLKSWSVTDGKAVYPTLHASYRQDGMTGSIALSGGGLLVIFR